MKRITEIKKIGKGERYYLYLDDELFGVYEAEILARYSLKSGQEFDDEFFEQLQTQNGDYACFNRSLSLLEKSIKSEKMLKDYLREKGYPKSSINSAIEKLKEYGYINDEAFAENFINSYSFRKSKRKLKFDLLTKGISEDIIDEKLSLLVGEEDEETLAFSQAEKYLANRELDLKTKGKFFNHMAGKGFDYGIISRAWEKISKNKENID